MNRRGFLKLLMGSALGPAAFLLVPRKPIAPASPALVRIQDGERVTATITVEGDIFLRGRVHEESLD